MAALISAETLLGDSACARGSQGCSGTAPALPAMPKTSNRKMTAATTGGNPPATDRRWAKSAPPAAADNHTAPTSRATNPAWVSTAYQVAAPRTAGWCLCSVRTRSSEVIAISSQPISSVYNNFENFQDITNDNLISYANSWFDGPIDRIDLEYEAVAYASVFTEIDSLRQNSARASLSWRLTTREKQGIIQNIGTISNQTELEKLRALLAPEKESETAGEVGPVGSR